MVPRISTPDMVESCKGMTLKESVLRQRCLRFVAFSQPCRYLGLASITRIMPIVKLSQLPVLLDYYLCRQRNGDHTIVLVLKLCLEQLIDGIDAMLMMFLRYAEHTEQPSRMRWLGWLGG